MTTIDEIMRAAEDFAFSAVDRHSPLSDESDWQRCDLLRDLLRTMIVAAIDNARREGAEQMREALPEALRQKFIRLPRYSFHLHNGGVRRVPDSCGNWVEHHAAHELFDPEHSSALPLPTGPRQAVRLTEEQIGRMYCAVLGEEYIEPTDVEADKEAHAALMRVTRAIETAVLAANGIGGRE